MIHLPSSARSGFTLIEMVITVAILLVVTGGGVAAFIRFNDRQEVQTATNEIRQFLKTAQTRARVRDNSDQAGCTLQGYRVENNGQVLEMKLLCGTSKFAVAEGATRDTYTIPSSLTLSPLEIDFYTLAGSAGVSLPLDNEVRINGSGYYYMFTIEDTGEIREGCFVQSANSDICI